MFFHDENEIWKPDLGIGFGYWKEELPGSEIISYQSLGPKQYNIVYKIGDEEKEVCKISGVKLTQVICDGKVDAQTFNDLLCNEIERFEIPQFIETGKKMKKALTRKGLNKSRLFNPFSLRSVPYGWKFDLVGCSQGFTEKDGEMVFIDHLNNVSHIDKKFFSNLLENGHLYPRLKYILR